MDNFNLQKFVKKSKSEFYAKLYEGKKEHAMEEEMHDDVKEDETLNEGVDLKSLMNGDKVNNDALVVMAQSYKNEEDARKQAMRPKAIKDNSENAGPGAKLMVFANLAGGPDREMKIEDGKVVDIRLFSDWDSMNEEKIEELDAEVADRIEGLLNIPMKAKFISVGIDLINDFLEDEAMDVEDVVSHLANELEKEYHAAGDHDTAVALDEGEDEEDPHEMDETVEEDLTNEVSLNVSDVEAAMSFLGGALGLPAVAFLSAKAQEKLKAMKDKKAASAGLTEEEEEMDVEIEDEAPAMDVDLDISTDEPDNKEVFSQLVDAYESAKELGDEKLTRQLANTITYFNKTIIFGDEE